MTRLFVLMFLLIFHAVLFAAGSPDLLLAVPDCDHSQVEKLLREGADVNTADAEGATALMHSVIESDFKMMKLLIDNKADVNSKNAADSTALMSAATKLAKTNFCWTRELI